MSGGPNVFQFNRWDWGVAIAATALVGGAFLGLNSLLIENKMNALRVDFARIDANVINSLDQMNKGFEDHRAEVNALLASGLEERSNEIAEALLAGLDQQQTYKLSVVNVAWPQEAEALVALAASFDGPTRVVQLGNKAVIEFEFTNVDDPKVQELQTLLNEVKNLPDVDSQISIFHRANP